jgi:hypothetical protein
MNVSIRSDCHVPCLTTCNRVSAEAGDRTSFTATDGYCAVRPAVDVSTTAANGAAIAACDQRAAAGSLPNMAFARATSTGTRYATAKLAAANLPAKGAMNGATGIEREPAAAAGTIYGRRSIQRAWIEAPASDASTAKMRPSTSEATAKVRHSASEAAAKPAAAHARRSSAETTWPSHADSTMKSAATEATPV